MLMVMLAVSLAFQDDAAATEAINSFEAAFAKNKDSSARAGEISKLARTPHEKVVGRIRALLTHEDKAVRIAAAQALSGFGTSPEELRKSASHAVGSASTAGINSRDAEVLSVLFTTIGHLQEESSGSVIKSRFEGKDAKIAGAAISAAGALRSKTLIEPLIELLRECEREAKSGDSAPPPTNSKVTRVPKTSKNGGGSGGGEPQQDPEAARKERARTLIPTIQGALQSLTGQSFATGEEWSRWWSKNRGSFSVPKN